GISSFFFLLPQKSALLAGLVNGTEVYSGAGMTLTEIGMAMTGPDWRPASVSYWDSVSVSVSPVPEGGATLSMLACALFGLLLVARPSK
ncbi:MAG TPA: hypothetical protein P5534_12840, partial [Candidatus Paceibacterota bacterium]|nr:hypothetical protein [Candidatus Paceibacterota bacterium]